MKYNSNFQHLISIRSETENFIREHVESGDDIQKFFIGMPRSKYTDCEEVYNLICQQIVSNMKRNNILPSRVKTLYKCDADHRDELSFVAGEIIAVTGI